jgi:hypothetical protein
VRVRSLAALVRDDAIFAEQLRTSNLATVLSAARARPAFWKVYQDYLARFGDRCLEELKLESATLEDDPLPLLRAVGHFAARSEQAPADHAAKARAAAEIKVSARLGWNPWRRLLFGWVLRNARARVRNRENLRFERTRLFGRVRRIVMELGHRLHAVGALAAARDVFYLELVPWRKRVAMRMRIIAARRHRLIVSRRAVGWAQPIPSPRWPRPPSLKSVVISAKAPAVVLEWCAALLAWCAIRAGLNYRLDQSWWRSGPILDGSCYFPLLLGWWSNVVACYRTAPSLRVNSACLRLSACRVAPPGSSMAR